jgi:Anthrone oxygenase
VKLVQFIALLLFSLVTGVFWGTWFSLSRSIDTITPSTFLEVGHIMIGNLGGSMSVLMPAALLIAVFLGVLLYRRQLTQASLFTFAAFALLLVALIITLTVNVPIDRQIQFWTTGTLPPDWTAIRDRWEFYHGLRTLISVVGLACLFAGTLSTASTARITRDQQGGPDERRGTSRPTAA